jgi:hypothetical protein
MSGRLHTRAKLCRFGAYFACAFTLIWCAAGPLPLVYQQYRAEHEWPMAEAKVKSFHQQSRTIHPDRGWSYRVYWMEFLVTLDLPISECPGPMRTSDHGSALCAGTYRSMETKSAADAWKWGSRHPILSSVKVHYSPKGEAGNRVFFAGEPASRTYPWKEIFGVFVMMLITGLLFAVAAKQEKRADRLEPQDTLQAA